MIFYLHGFRSAPASHKATRLREHMQGRGLVEHYWCEQLSHVPAEAVAQIDDALQRIGGSPTLVGSSLGGYYSTWFAERYDLRAVLVNPGVLSYLSLEPWIGVLDNFFTGETFEFTREHIAQLRAIEVEAITRPSRYWLMVETGDEVLDYQHAVAKYVGARQTVLEGGDHSFTRWDDYLDEILRFAGLAR